MKTIFTTLLIITCFATVSAQDTITNPGFERWTNFGTYDEPNANWHSLNPLTSSVGAVVAFKATGADAHSGDNAIKLVAKSVLGSPTASLVTTGTINVVQQSVDGGCTISARPVALGGWYKYSPVGGDTASFTIILTKWNGSSRDTIGRGSFSTSTAQASYTAFSVPVIYALPAVPDTAQLLFVTSGENSSHVNTTLYVDDVFYDFSTGIADQKVESLKLYPNPTSGEATLMFNLEGAQHIDIAIFNTMGQLVKGIYTGNTNGGLNQVQFTTAGLAKGIYWVRLNAGNATQTEKLVVE